MDAPQPEHLRCLKTRFGFDDFYPEQWKVISSILNNAEDNCVVLKSAYGKSLCYQFPAVFLNTITVVITPFISLMEDQVQWLSSRNISACLLGSAQSNPNILNEIYWEKYNIVYMAPEYRELKNLIHTLGLRKMLTLIAVDEAHYINTAEYRESYPMLRDLRKICPNVPILAVATIATEAVQDDIIDTLQLCDPQIITGDLNRPNINFIVRQMCEPNNVWSDIGPFINELNTGSIIVRCQKKEISRNIFDSLIKNQQSCGIYITDFNMSERRSVQNEFMFDRIRVIVATQAFGTGLNKPNVRLVIHYGEPDDLEKYFHETGIASRDGEPAKCVLFYDKDYRRNNFLVEDMKNYISTANCRRQFILSKLEQDCSNLAAEREDCCDNCTCRVNLKEDFLF